MIQMLHALRMRRASVSNAYNGVNKWVGSPAIRANGNCSLSESRGATLEASHEHVNLFRAGPPACF
jgi:hypothetical protein